MQFPTPKQHVLVNRKDVLPITLLLATITGVIFFLIFLPFYPKRKLHNSNNNRELTQVKSYYESYVKYDSDQNNAKCA